MCESYVVSIKCNTFNHSVYIRDAFDGFVMQQTSFPFIAIVVDDASTDGAQKVIKAYLDDGFDKSTGSGFRQWETEDATWFFANHKENRNCHFLVLFLKKNLYGNPKKNELVKEWFDKAKFKAICEGDDYWTDSLKLQKQVDFLEEHEEYDLCCAASMLYEHNKGCFIGLRGSALCEDYITIVQGYNDINTATALVRTKVWNDCIKELSSFLPPYQMIDTAYWYWFAYHGKIKYMSDRMAVYRVLENSACHTTDKEKRLVLDLKFLRLKLDFLLRYPLPRGQEEVVNKLVEEIMSICNYSRYLGELNVRNTRTFKLGKTLKKMMFWK